MQKKLCKKYFQLFFGELIATILFAFIWIEFIYMVDWGVIYLTSPYTISVFLVLEFILLQGTLYWYLKWKQAKRNIFMSLANHNLLIFLVCKRINVFLLAIGFLVLIYLIFSQSDYLYWYTFLYLFAAAEFINYYYYRLSYQTLSELKELFYLIRKRKLKPSKLSNELNR